MKIGLIQVDGTLPNLALMKLSKHYKNLGHEVVLIDLSTLNIDQYFASKIFIGGSGVDLKAKLPRDIEALTPDYNLYNLDYSIGFSSRGCPNNCGFCIVKEKEGDFIDDSLKFIKHGKVILFDNNFLASPKCKEKLKYFIDNKLKVNFNQGLDIRRITPEIAALLSKVKYYDKNFNMRRLYFAWDNINDEAAVLNGIDVLIKAGIKPYSLTFYILCGFNTTFKEDYRRFDILQNKGVDPYVMVYNKTSLRHDSELLKFQRFVNRRLYKIFDYKDYNGGFKN